MAHPKRRAIAQLDTGTVDMNGIVANTITGGPALPMVNVDRGLVAMVTLEAETNTVTLRAYWEGSVDGTNYYEIPESNNAAQVVWCTGTAGADAPLTKFMTPPEGVYSLPYARVSVINGVVDAVTGDTYQIRYYYIKPNVA